MQLENCKYASSRKVQRLCRNGFIDCYKLKTTRNGQPVSEWLVSETSLRKRIEEHEPRFEDGDVIVTHNQTGGANSSAYIETSPAVIASPSLSGAAKSEAEREEHLEDLGNDVTTPEQIGDANSIEPSKASLMIENAKLTAELEGNRALIAKFLDDEGFLREELRDAREGRKDVAKIAERMLEALETMALGGKLQRLQNPDHPTRNPISKRNPDQYHSNQPTAGDIQQNDFEQFRI